MEFNLQDELFKTYWSSGASVGLAEGPYGIQVLEGVIKSCLVPRWLSQGKPVVEQAVGRILAYRS